MSKDLLPKEFIDNSSIVYKYKISVRSQIIYILILAFVTIAIFSLPFIRVTISVPSPGIIQSEKERTDILIPASGRVIQNNLSDNKKVKAGDTLLSIDSRVQDQQSALLKDKRSEISNFIKDAYTLLNTTRHPDLRTQPALASNQYLASWQEYVQQATSTNNSYLQAKRTFKKAEELYKNEMITANELDKAKFELDQSTSNHLLTIKKYSLQWEADITRLKNELAEIDSKGIELREQTKLYTYRASIDGTIQNLIGIQTGAYVFINQKVGEISPEAPLYAYCFVKPSDIGLLRKNQKVNLQIDAFNYNQWGFITGTVSDISDDILEIGKEPFFKVKCKLNSTFLKLKTGHKESVKKGMTCSARFIVAERTILQLLFNNLDDWMNPAVADNTNQ